MDSNDAELLREWLEERNETAFRALVERYAGLVHMAAKRVCNDGAIASEVSQMVFILLAKKAETLRKRASLAGWLHLTAVLHAKNLMKHRRRELLKHERYVGDMKTEPPGAPVNEWDEWRPLIDDALTELPEKDREALFLHFYRSREVREVARSLGIGPDTARKRIQRAMEKLKGKLVRRGCRMGGVFSATVAAGLAGDAQTTGLPVALMSMKATAAGTGCGAGLVLSTAVFMKASSFIPPLIALVVAGIWIAPKRNAIAVAERKYLSLETGNGGQTRPRAERRTERTVRENPEKAGNGSIDWEAIAMQEMDEEVSGRVGNFLSIARMTLDRRLKAMTGEELMSELERIDGIDVSDEAKEKMRNRLYGAIAGKDPAFALAHLERWLGSGANVAIPLANALRAYAKTHPAEAVAWLDRQIAEGRLEVKRLDGGNRDRNWLEGALLQVGLTHFPEMLASRLRALEEGDRLAALSSIPPRLPPEEQVAYARLIREMADEADQARMIARLGLVLNGDFRWVDDYLARIKATDAERLATYERALDYSLAHTSRDRKLTAAEMVRSWNWIGERMPESRVRLVGEALGNSWSEHGPTDFEDVAKLALQLHQVSESDGMLAAFLKSKGALRRKERSGKIAEMISNERLKAEVMEALK